ncbi:unnamed protein product [Linum trigynum]|uniref:Uncharacterized protein n=1 Tax=Linum trigynum TaxID=586398 RepID=A0AAV2GIF5_9ROSI
MDRVMKSAFYKGYIQNVTAEATMQMVAAIIRRRKDEIGDENVYWRDRRPRSPVYNDEWDLMRADLEDVEADIISLGKQKEELKQAILRKTSPKLPYPPPGPVKGALRLQEPSRWGVDHIIRAIVRRQERLPRGTSLDCWE